MSSVCCLVTAPHFNMLASALIIRRVTIIKPSRCSNLNLIRVVFVAFDADGASGCLLFPKLAASSWAEPMWTFKRVALCVQGNLQMSLPAQLAQRLTRGATFLFRIRHYVFTLNVKSVSLWFRLLLQHQLISATFTRPTATKNQKRAAIELEVVQNDPIFFSEKFV